MVIYFIKQLQLNCGNEFFALKKTSRPLEGFQCTVEWTKQQKYLRNIAIVDE